MRIQIQICNADYSVPVASTESLHSHSPREKNCKTKNPRKLDNMRLKHTKREKHSPKPERIPMKAKTISSDGS